MKPSFDEELAKRLKDFNDEFCMKDNNKQALKHRIIGASKQSKQHSFTPKKGWIVAITMFTLLILTSPMYSSSMAALASKILPLGINSSFSDSKEYPDLHVELSKVITEAGFEIGFIGTTYNPYTIEVGLSVSKDDFSAAKDTVTPQIDELLYNSGINEYNLKITHYAVSDELPKRHKEASSVMDNAGIIIKKVFSAHGYDDLAEHFTHGIKNGLFSNTLTIDIPDDIKDAKEIIQEISQAVEQQELDIKDVKVEYYNAQHRAQDDRWAYIVSDINDALAGKSQYKITGLSYQVKDGLSKVYLKSKWTEMPSAELVTEIEQAINTYLASPDIDKQIGNDAYSIQILMGNKEPILTITSP